MRDVIRKYWIFVLIPLLLIAALVVYAVTSADSSAFGYDV